ncbi:MAG: hypothetical protein ACXVB0_18825, partial [Mucilaginibacter sp.]
IVLTPGVIQVNEGCGITSQGYLIIQDTAQYKYYTSYSPVDVPNDLPFQYLNGNLPFYKPFCTGKQLWLLLTDDQYTALEPAQQLAATPLSSAAAGFFSDYVIVLFLELAEMDLKNCNMLDCNNKGEKMTLQVRPLLVAKTDLPGATPPIRIDTPPLRTGLFPGVGAATGVDTSLLNIHLGFHPNFNFLPEIDLKRFNVPYADLNNTDDVVNAFVSLVDDTTLSQVANALNYCYTQYATVLNISTNPFTNLLSNLQNYRSQILTQDPVLIEYFYDLIDDLTKAYREFSIKAAGLISTCCPDENLFPLHLILGDASLATDQFVKDGYRTYFIYSPLFSKGIDEESEVVLLFNRMVIMVNQFTIVSQTLTIQQVVNIQITPSQFEHFPLSDRAIPYYYNPNVSGSELYKSWNYKKTINGNAASILSYNSSLYSSNPAVKQPLLYDIERYNFFRVEGHIGLNYQTALSNILSQRQTYNLPFDVVAISADLLSSTAALPQCNFLDLETGYKLIVGEAACKIHTTFCFITKMPYTPPPPSQIFLNRPVLQTTLTLVPRARTANATGATLEAGAGIKATAVDPTLTATAATGAVIDTTNAIDFSTFKLNAVATLEPVFTLTTAYKKGDFMRKYCTPDANTIGSGYLNALNSNGVFTNPITLDQSNPLTIAYYYLFQYVDAVEQLMYVLQTNTLEQINMADFGQEYLGYLGITTLSISILEAMAIQNANTAAAAAPSPYVTLSEDLGLDALVDDLGVLTSICIDERLQVLKDEYTNRLNQYQQQHTFLNYYKNHLGLEHKAGVPKGGTLVLVYHSAQQTTAVNPVNPVLTNPIFTNPVLTNPVFTNPIVTNPVVTNPVVTNPVVTVTNPVVTNPVVTNPVVTVTNPVITDPVVTNPVVTVTNPVVSDPVTTNPVLTNPVVTNPVVTNPVLTNPVVTNPVITNPVTTNPVLTNPVITNPVVTNPVTTNPILTKPVINAPGPIRTSPVFAQHAITSQILANPVLTKTVLVNPVVTAAAPAPAVSIDANTFNLLRNFAGNLQDVNQKQILINILGNQPAAQQQSEYQVTDGVIIADFYIPYMCCSDCPPMAYIMPPPAPAQPKPTVTIAPAFCVNDTVAEPFTVSAPGGTFNTVPGLDGTKQTFTPATAGVGTFNIVYTLNGVDSDPKTVTVLPVPNSDFSFNFKFVTDVNKNLVLNVDFAATTVGDGFTYKWTLGPSFSVTQSTSASLTVTANWAADKEIDDTVTLVVANQGLDCGLPGITKKLAITANGVTEVTPTAAAGGTIISNFEKSFTKKKKS